ncbi:UvrD-helicase domain-containing protein [Proteus vulgaris]|uniref:UvrD-helicase domain-containing protein n=1 Tax=Proteus vulgaris TaxID=585 RepID=UPI00065967C5|nr:UvrD-helicase domain-containing protein [Proteus vulgaris]CRL66030.1 ATP-dependent DNA helicase PcrA [Proteus vulgaris]
MMNNWKPTDGIDETKELMDIITFDNSVAVLAGAGAGKTELLAQKANYLFSTNKCIWPKRILSLTFKTEAQINIKERINKRCGNKSNRFDSFTFHAFSKSIVDRFKSLLPEEKRPSDNYDIVFNKKHLSGNNKVLMSELLSLTISILKERDDIRKIFSYSYSYIFIDEFQDTTDEQYELLKILFKGSDAKILAVGDINQSIMLWAGARKTVFTDFLKDFNAKNKFLVKNYRASVEIQNVLELLLEFIKNKDNELKEISDIPQNCSLHLFNDEYKEARFIAKRISTLVKNGVEANKICVLTKQESSSYTRVLRDELTKLDITSLDMNELKDALKEPLGKIFSLFLTALISSNPKSMAELFLLVLSLNNIDDEIKENKIIISLQEFIFKKKGFNERNRYCR